MAAYGEQLAGTAAAWRAVGRSGCRLAHCGGSGGAAGDAGQRRHGAGVAIAIAATLLTWHTGRGRHGVCFAFAVLLDWALLGALMVRNPPAGECGLIPDAVWSKESASRATVTLPARR